MQQDGDHRERGNLKCLKNSFHYFSHPKASAAVR
jgi:hypothetical protein